MLQAFWGYSLTYFIKFEGICGWYVIEKNYLETSVGLLFYIELYLLLCFEDSLFLLCISCVAVEGAHVLCFWR